MGGDYNAAGGSLACGSLTQPVDLGSGGYPQYGLNPAGGGAIHLIVTSTMQLDGSISANGLFPGGYAGGGGQHLD